MEIRLKSMETYRYFVVLSIASLKKVREYKRSRDKNEDKDKPEQVRGARHRRRRRRVVERSGVHHRFLKL